MLIQTLITVRARGLEFNHEIKSVCNVQYAFDLDMYNANLVVLLSVTKNWLILELRSLSFWQIITENKSLPNII